MLRSRVVLPSRLREIYAFPHNTFDDGSSKLKDLEPGSLSVLVIEARIPGDKGSKGSLIFHIGTDIQSRKSPPRSRAVFALSNDVSHTFTFISHSEVI